ncbi:MAG: fused MFS/spermidine synthase [Nitrospirae bacterium]|nr:fused MFS/spermidine synthase [Nitrospirota bacterium]
MKNHATGLKITAFLSGAVIMVLEILGFRILSPYFGYSVYVSGSLIGIVMVALALGYYAGGHIADRRPKKIILFQLILAADIYIIIISFFYKDLLASFSGLGVIYGAIVSSIVLFAPSMILLAMVPPFIIRLMTHDSSEVGKVAGDITAIGTIGSIIGTFSATFILIPWIGSHWTMYLCSVILLFTAVWGLAAQKKKYALLILLSFAFNLFPPKTEPGTLFEKESPYNLVKVTETDNGRRILTLNSNKWFHSVYNPHSELVNGYYDYLNIAPALTDAKEILILGMGAGTSAKQFLSFFDADVDAVEIDPLVIEAGKEYFGLKESVRLRIYAEDARPFLQNSGKFYDVIELDVYHGGVYAPFYVLTKEFFRSVYDHLSPGGIIAINVLSPAMRENRTLLVDTVGKTLSSVFPSIYKIDITYNHLLFATKEKTDLYSIKNMLMEYKGAKEIENITAEASKKILSLEIKEDALVLSDDKAPVDEITYRMMSGANKIPHLP